MAYARPVGGMAMPHTQLGQVAQNLGEQYFRSLKSPVEQERDKLIMRHTEAQTRRETLEGDKLQRGFTGQDALAGRVRSATPETIRPTMQQGAADLIGSGAGGVDIGEMMRAIGSLFDPNETQARNLNLGAGGRALGVDDSFTEAGQATLRQGNFAQETGLNNANIAGRANVAGIQGQTDRDVQGLRNTGALAERQLMEQGLGRRHTQQLGADLYDSEADRRAEATAPQTTGRAPAGPRQLTPQDLGRLQESLLDQAFDQGGEELVAEVSGRIPEYLDAVAQAYAASGDIARAQAEGLRAIFSPEPQPAAGGAPAIPNAAIEMLRGDPSPDAVREFEEVFGPGSAQLALGGA